MHAASPLGGQPAQARQIFVEAPQMGRAQPYTDDLIESWHLPALANNPPQRRSPPHFCAISGKISAIGM